MAASYGGVSWEELPRVAMGVAFFGEENPLGMMGSVADMDNPFPVLTTANVAEEALRPIAQLLLTEELVTRFGIERITRFQLGVPVAGRRRLRVEWLPSTRNRSQVMQRREVSGTLTL